jgi:lactate dehydrogenase-like 2-hydroxyacid dehydrogenase
LVNGGTETVQVKKFLMMKKILVTRKLLKENEDKLKELFEVKLNSNDKKYSAQEIIEASKDCDGILSSVTDPISADTISKLSNSVKIIANGAVGFGNIDFKAARAKGVAVTNTPDVLTDATADIQILLLLGASRKAYEGRIAAETQSWNWSWDFLLGKQMSNKRLGILGMGRIGRAVARRAKGFGMEIHYHNRSKLSPDLEDGAIYHKDLKSLFEQSEFLSINCPATPETIKIINKESLSYLKDNAVIANAARGDVIDDDAMVASLKNGKVFAYGLDVYNGEPKIHPEYLKLKNIFLLPHLGSATKRTRWDMAYRATKNLVDFFDNKEPQDLIN